MLGLIIAVLKLTISTQKTILEHLIFLHKMIGSPHSNYIILQSHLRILNETYELVERNETHVSDL